MAGNTQQWEFAVYILTLSFHERKKKVWTILGMWNWIKIIIYDTVHSTCAMKKIVLEPGLQEMFI